MNCKKCPGNNGPSGCPWWWEYTETNSSGETRLTKECGIQALPKFLGHVIAASNRPAAAIESTRNALVNSLNAVGQILDKRVEDGIAQISSQAVPLLDRDDS